MSMDDQKSPPPQNETSSNNPRVSSDPTLATNDGETSSQHSDPNVEETQPAQTEVTSKTEDPETSKPTSPTAADSRMGEETPSEHTSASPNAKPDLIQSTQGTGGTKSSQQDSAAVADTGAPGKNPMTDAGGETSSQGSIPHNNVPSEITAEPEPTTEENINTKEKPPSDAHLYPSANNETFSKELHPQIGQAGGNVTGKPSLRSIWKKVKKIFPNKDKRAESKRSDHSLDDKGSDDKDDTSKFIRTELQGDKGSDDKDGISKFTQTGLQDIQKGADTLQKLLEEIRDAIKIIEGLPDFLKKENPRKYWKVIHDLQLQIPAKYMTGAEDIEGLKKLEEALKGMDIVPREVRDLMPQVHNTVVFESSMEFQDFEARYNELSTELKLCLLCFSIFPDDAVITKRLMLQWWDCEGFAKKDDGHGYFNELMERGFIEPVNKNESNSVGECRMHPFYRSALAMLAERARFFNFDIRGEPVQNFSGSCQACLVGDGVLSYEDLTNEFYNNKREKDGLEKVLKETLEKVHLLINVKERKLEFKPEWFSMMKNVNFIHLGNWRSTDHVEVESTTFLEKVGNMDYLKFLSLQGVANVIKLTASIKKFANLETLDLRACHNLEKIPEEIGSLQNLKHLDTSGCTLLDHMPKGLCQLKKLEVIKGFVVSKEKKASTCTLEDLEKLKSKLKKLCIYTGSHAFPDDDDVEALGKLEELLKLTITWGGTESQTVPLEREESSSNCCQRLSKCFPKSKLDSEKSADSNISQQLPPKLEKLDLKCFPNSKTPDWLALHNLARLEHLKKLYIRAGKFSDLGQYQDIDDRNLVWPGKKKYTWKVTDLRLKFLSEIELDWTQLWELFPHLEYLEQVDCPKLTLFPCDANGVWRKKSG